MQAARSQTHPHARPAVFVVLFLHLFSRFSSAHLLVTVDLSFAFFSGTAAQYKPPPPPSPEEIARREAEKAEEARWLERAKAAGPPEPPIATYQPGSSGL